MTPSPAQPPAADRPALDRTHLPDGIPVVVACSGGSDSTALLHLVAAAAPSAGWNVTIAHLDHALRPESATDALFVQKTSASLGLRCITSRRNIRVLAESGEGPEAAARRVRYGFLHEVRERLGESAVILTGHTADDQAETVALRLARGAGLRGLRGILARRGDGVVRPILHERREGLQAWLRSRHLGWRVDPTNRDPSIPRSGLRLALESMPVPVREELVERACSIARQTSRLYPLLLDAARWWNETHSAGIARRLSGGPGGRGSTGLWPGEFLLETPPDRLHLRMLDQAILDAALEALGADPRDVTRRLRDELLRDPGGGGRGAGGGRVTQLGYDLWAESIDGALLLARGAGPNWEEDHGWRADLPVPAAACRTSLDLPRGGAIAVRLLGREELDQALSRARAAGGGAVWAVVDRRCAKRLSVRYPRGGDVMRPFGMHGSRRLSDLFGETGVPRLRRGRLPVIESEGEILWLAGLRASEAGRIDQEAENGIMLELVP